MNQMEINQIRQLLAKYSEGNTTLKEEKVLQAYFTEEREIDMDLLSWRHQFVVIKAGREYNFDITGLETKILSTIDGQISQAEPKNRKIYFYRMLIAASVAIMIGISGVIFYQLQKNNNKDTFTDPQLAYNETQRALLYVSQKMNKGIEPLSNISIINTATKQLKTLEKMDQSLGMLNLVSFINSSSNLKK
jgi:hypothetical protein